MNIAILSYGFLPNVGGGEIVLAELASRLSREGNTVIVISNFAGPVGMSKNYLVHRTPRLPSEIASRVAHLLVAPFMLLFIHLVNKVDVVQSAGLMDVFAAFPVKMMFRVPVILRLSMWKHADLLKRLKTAVSFMANIIIALRSDMKAELIEGGLKGNRIRVIPNGVDTNKFRPSLTDRHKMIMLWVGRLDSHKEPHLAIETLSLIKDAYKNFCLQIVGEGEIKEQLQELVSKHGLQDSVKFLGYQSHDKVAEIMRNADIFLITSKGEGMSNALLEAMACGMVVVATSASSCGVIQNGVNGFIANELDMASIVSRLIDDEVLRRKIGENARRTVLEKFSADRMFSAYLQLYENLTLK